MEMFIDGKSLGEHHCDWKKIKQFLIPGFTKVVSVKGMSASLDSGILGSFSNGLVTNESWKCSLHWFLGWSSPDFDDSPWSAAVVVAEYGNIPGIDPAAKWIWTNPRGFDEAYCRLSLR